MNNFFRLTLVLAALASTCQPTYAADQILEFKLVTRNLDLKMHEAKNVEGQSIGVAKAYGVAYFKDGRIASKDYVYTGSFAGAKGVGSFETTPAKLPDASLMNGKFSLSMP